MDLSCSIHTYYIIGIDRFKGLNNYHLARIQTAISYKQSRRPSDIQDPDVYQLFGIQISVSFPGSSFSCSYRILRCWSWLVTCSHQDQLLVNVRETETKFMAPLLDSGPLQRVIVSSLVHATPCHPGVLNPHWWRCLYNDPLIWLVKQNSGSAEKVKPFGLFLRESECSSATYSGCLEPLTI